MNRQTAADILHVVDNMMHDSVLHDAIEIAIRDIKSSINSEMSNSIQTVSRIFNEQNRSVSPARVTCESLGENSVVFSGVESQCKIGGVE